MNDKSSNMKNAKTTAKTKKANRHLLTPLFNHAEREFRLILLILVLGWLVVGYFQNPVILKTI
jgi:hypothetical protein